ncbi:FAD-dependent oxidoreductase [Nocardia carnea]|uniref:FAD-dependent oxidoreductase n=1 Tax=Nocardia carnea TaxID=37328 RepID=UPI002453872B|nr:FAD-dependent oxidoreductase [Nocardia carnea]
MRSGSRIAIVGAGIAGLVCAKVLAEDGFAVEVFDRAPDIGGVWSETRRYPGLRAQSTKYTYHFSDHPMPADYPRVLDGARMQEYLSSYVRAFGLTDRLRLRTEVVAADPVEGGWLLEIRDADGVHRTSCDHLIIANGVFSEPEIPDFAGATAYARAGGQLGHSTQFLDVEAVRERAVVVVGYGAAAADIATEISKVAADTTLVARRLLWKMPRKVATGMDAERILLTRTGAAHFGHPEPGRFERLLHGPARSFRESNLDLIEALVAQRSGAAELGLVPDRRFEQAHDAAFGLATEGFAEQVTQGRLTVRGQTTVIALGGGPAGPFAELSDGQRVRADIVVCATGFQQRVPFLTPYVQRQLTDDDGNFRLYRQILPLDVPHLTFAGYNTSLLTAVSAEISAHWTAALLTGNLALPAAETMNERIDTRLRWLDQHTGGRHAHGTVTPDAIRDIDELLADIGVRLPFAARTAQWLRPVRPGDYRVVSRRKRGPGTHATAPAAAEPAAAHPSTAPLATAAQAVPHGPAGTPGGPAEALRPDAADPPSAGAQLPPPQAPAAATESPTVRIPEAVAASAVRTTTLPAVDPAASTRPVPEVRPTTAPGAARPLPAPSQFVPAAPAPEVTSRSAAVGSRPPAQVPQPPAVASQPPAVGHQSSARVRRSEPAAPSAAARQAAAEAERRAAAEQRAAGIAARSNSPTVRIDMRTAQSLVEGPDAAQPGSATAPGAGGNVPGAAPSPAQSTETVDDSTRRAGSGQPETASGDEQSVAEQDTVSQAADSQNHAAGPAADAPGTADHPGPADRVTTRSAAQTVAENTTGPAMTATTDEVDGGVSTAAEMSAVPPVGTGAAAGSADRTTTTAATQATEQTAEAERGAVPPVEVGAGSAGQASAGSSGVTVPPGDESGAADRSAEDAPADAGPALVEGGPPEQPTDSAVGGEANITSETGGTGSSEPAAGTAAPSGGGQVQPDSPVQGTAASNQNEPASVRSAPTSNTGNRGYGAAAAAHPEEAAEFVSAGPAAAAESIVPAGPAAAAESVTADGKSAEPEPRDAADTAAQSPGRPGPRT